MTLQKSSKNGLHTGKSREKCANCHALIAVNGKISADLLGWTVSSVWRFRKRNGLKILSRKEATKSVNKRKGKTAKEISDSWKQEWVGVVDNYWSKCNAIHAERIYNPEMREMSDGMVAYYLNHEESKKREALRARINCHRCKSNSLQAVKSKLRNHIQRVCRKSKTGKTRKTIEYLGCTINQAREHIQKQFQNGMNWNNHGLVWEIDHIIPMCHFDLSREDHRMRVNHFTNLQPMLKRENRMKSGKIINNAQVALL